MLLPMLVRLSGGMVALETDIIYGYAQTILSQTPSYRNHLHFKDKIDFANTQTAFMRTGATHKYGVPRAVNNGTTFD